MKNKRRNKEHRSRRGFYLLPSMFTTASLLGGFYAIVSAINGDFYHSAVAIIVSAVCDAIDGRVARLTHTTSKFGMEYDSLCDLVAFGVAPALVAYLWALKPYGRFGWLAAFLYVATTALRLARFNITPPRADMAFTGIPCPAAACTIATAVLFSRFLGATGTIKHISILLLVYFLSYLMVSTFRYVSFKHPETTARKPFHTLVSMVLLIMVIATEPEVTLFLLALVYTFSGPADGLWRAITTDPIEGEVKKQEHLTEIVEDHAR